MKSAFNFKGATYALLLLLILSCFSVLWPNLFANNLPQASDDAASVILPNMQIAQVKEHKATTVDLAKLQHNEGVFSADESANAIGVDAHPPTADEWATIAANAYIVDNISPLDTLPSSFDNSQTPWFPPIGNQGHGCNAFSVGYYMKTFMEAKEHGWDLSGARWEGQNGGIVGYPSPNYQDKIMSPAFIYNLNNPSGSIESTIGVVNNIGVCSWKTMPYVADNYTLWPSEQAWIEAAYYRGNSTTGYQYIDLTTDAGLVNLKAWLTSQNLASFLVDGGHKLSKTNLEANDVLTSDHYLNAVSDHVNTIVGYNDDISYAEDGQTHYGAFKVANSWGVGGWENIPDGYYWVSYEAMKQGIRNCVFYYDLIGYQPDLMACFKIEHDKRSDCTITLGLGSISQPTTTKLFSQIVSSYPYPYSPNDYLPFPDNNIVVDVTEFENYFSSIYGQTFWLSVTDSASTPTTGVIINFGINSSFGYEPTSECPCPTINGLKETAAVNFPTQTSTMNLPVIGGAGQEVKFTGSGFAPSGTANLSYLNPLNNQLYLVDNNIPISGTGTLSYTTTAPDLMRAIEAGQNFQSFDLLTYNIQDISGTNVSFPFLEFKRGLLRVGDSLSSGFWLYGNQTDLTTTVYASSGQPLRIVGCWFQPGSLRAFWDKTMVENYATAVDENGGFTIMLPVPITPNGPHTVTLENGNTNFTVSVNAYTTPTAPLFSLANEVLYTSLYGKITAYQADSGIPLWNIDTRTDINCLAADGTALYIGSANGVYAINITSRTFLWSTSSAYYQNSFALTLTNGVVYVSTKDGYFMPLTAEDGQSIGGDTGYYGTLPICNAIANGKIYLGLQDGRLRAYTIPSTIYWRQDSYYSKASWCSLAADGGLLFAASGNTIYAINKNDASTQWTQTLPETGNISLTLLNGQLYAGVASKIYSLNANSGGVSWSTNVANTISTIKNTSSGVCFVSGNDVQVINPSGNVLWSYPASGTVSILAVEGNLAFVSSSDGNINAIDTANGQKIWDLLGYTPPSSTPTPSPTPSPTSQPNTTPKSSPTQTNPPSTPRITAQPTTPPTNAPSSSPTFGPTQIPTATSHLTEEQPNMAVYAVVVAVAVVLLAIVLMFALKKRRH